MTFRPRNALALLALAAALAAPDALAFGNASVGDLIQDATLRTLDGKRQAVLDPGQVTLFAFVQPGQWQSLKTLRILSELRREVGARPIRMVAIVSDSATRAEREALAHAASPVPLLVDAGDVLSGAVGAFTFPSIGFAGRDRRLLANEIFTTVNLRDALRDRIEALVPAPGSLAGALAVRPPPAPRASARRDAAPARPRGATPELAQVSATELGISLDSPTDPAPARAAALASEPQAASAAVADEPAALDLARSEPSRPSPTLVALASYPAPSTATRSRVEADFAAAHASAPLAFASAADGDAPASGSIVLHRVVVMHLDAAVSVDGAGSALQEPPPTTLHRED